MSTTRREEHIQQLVAAAPPLTPEQVERLRMLLAVERDLDIMRRELRGATKGAGND